MAFALVHIYIAPIRFSLTAISFSGLCFSLGISTNMIHANSGESCVFNALRRLLHRAMAGTKLSLSITENYKYKY